MHRIVLIMWIAISVSGDAVSSTMTRALDSAIEIGSSTSETLTGTTESGSSNVEMLQTLTGTTERGPSNVEMLQTLTSTTESGSSNVEMLQTLTDTTENEPSNVKVSQSLNYTTDNTSSNFEILRSQNNITVNELRAAVNNMALRIDGLKTREISYKNQFRKLRYSIKLLEKTIATIKSQNSNQIPAVVAFHADWLDGNPTQYEQVLQYRSVSLNLGDAYDNNTGKFTAPRAGIYHFAVTSTPGAPNTGTIFNLVVDSIGSEELFLLGYNTPYMGYYSQSTIQGLVHLNESQEVWVKSSHPGDVYNSDYCTFSGFLLASDT
jgi:hypothetical protein